MRYVCDMHKHLYRVRGSQNIFALVHSFSSLISIISKSSFGIYGVENLNNSSVLYKWNNGILNKQVAAYPVL